MKKLTTVLMCIMLLTGCSGVFGHEVITEKGDYRKIFELTEFRFMDDGTEIFPMDVSDLDVENLYFEWKLGIVGSADIEMCLSVKYYKEAFDTEIGRLKILGGGTVIYDTESFNYPAYVTILGYSNTSYYALVDEENLTIHYVLLQLVEESDIDINKDFLPKDYKCSGEVKDMTINIYDYKY